MRAAGELEIATAAATTTEHKFCNIRPNFDSSRYLRARAKLELRAVFVLPGGGRLAAQPPPPPPPDSRGSESGQLKTQDGAEACRCSDIRATYVSLLRRNYCCASSSSLGDKVSRSQLAPPPAGKLKVRATLPSFVHTFVRSFVRSFVRTLIHSFAGIAPLLASVCARLTGCWLCQARSASEPWKST